MRVGVGRDRLVAGVALALLAAGAASPPGAPAMMRLVLAAAGGAVAAAALRQPGPGAAIAVLAAAVELAALPGLLWQLAMLVALAVFAVAARRWPALAPVWPPRGAVPAAATAACAAIAPVGLVGWVWLLRPDLGDLLGLVPDVPVTLLLLGALAFALGNALLEEWIWRGVLQDRLERIFPSPVALLLQAASFGAAHAHGFPRGRLGVLLAGGWAVLLGLLRRRAGGLLAPLLAHVVADATIAAIVLAWLR